MPKIRVLIADDSALMRRILRRIFDDDPQFEVVDTARDGEDAVVKARELRPDVITMDINMPKMDGLTAVQLIVAEGIGAVVMVSSLTQKGAVATYEALELGAFDCVLKPGGTVSADMSSVTEELRKKVKSAANCGVMQRIKCTHRRKTATLVPAARPVPASLPPGKFGYKAVSLGISTGGPSTLMEVLPQIPAGTNAAFFLVQHMPAAFITTFAVRLGKSCQIKVKEAESGMIVERGHCYIASGGLHLAVFQKQNGEVVIRTPSHPPSLFVPSVSVMMDSVFRLYGRETVGVLMTGIGDDGADMMVTMHQNGCHTIAESEETAIVYGMPREAIERGGASVIAPSFQVANEILKVI